MVFDNRHLVRMQFACECILNTGDKEYDKLTKECIKLIQKELNGFEGE